MRANVASYAVLITMRCPRAAIARRDVTVNRDPAVTECFDT
jgi:hypothetical protein